MCPLESTKQLLEEEVVCTTSLEHEELNKWSHNQDKSEVEIQKTGSQKVATYQGNSYSLADDILNNSFETMRWSPDLFHNLCLKRRVFVLTHYVYILLQDSSKVNPILGVQNILAERLTYYLPLVVLPAGRK